MAECTDLTGRSIAITGGYGFLGWHTACRLRALHGVDVVRLGRQDFADPDTLAAQVADVDTIIHLAGVNRAESEHAVEQGNLASAEALADALAQTSSRRTRRVHVVYANSLHERVDNAYGRGKRGGAEILGRATSHGGDTFADVLLPNLFGEHGRPAYNSFVATFCFEVAAGRQPTVTQDREVPLLHAQDGAASLIAAAALRTSHQVAPTGTPHRVSDVLAMVNRLHAAYVKGEVPDLSDKFVVDLFNTYRSYQFPGHFPYEADVHADARGDLFETVRSHGGTGQAFVSTTLPGAVRGDHYHLYKVERFFVVKGDAEISLRRLFEDEIVRFRVSGKRPAFVDMPTMWVHNIRNVGEEDLVTMFWSDQLLDMGSPDQYAEPVEADPLP
jgi:UDP-2-acetamido-2,6-beta-L-arabino-hexul-4-ose reductase